MCKTNLILILPNKGSKRSQPFNNNIIDRPIKYSYNYEQLINMSNSKYCKNLLDLPAGTIKTIRDLRPNRRKIRTKIHENNSTKMSQHKKSYTSPNCKPGWFIQNWQLGICKSNARSLKSKENLISEAIEEYKLDALVITETRLQDN